MQSYRTLIEEASYANPRKAFLDATIPLLNDPFSAGLWDLAHLLADACGSAPLRLLRGWAS